MMLLTRRLSKPLPETGFQWINSLCVSNVSSKRKYTLKKGDEVSGFIVKDVKEVPEFSISAVRLAHLVTGADYLHLYKDDPNNVFSVSFKTIPADSKGVAHILEHTVLCGSKQFPVRDPFFKMLNRSFSTFMNAMTGSDFTVYPFSTQNQKDFRNLMSIYMDAVFNPLLKPLDFIQEGWRLEHEDPDNKASPLVFKGVVYNEMKGALADTQRYFAEKVQNALLPDSTYAYCSGGCPKAIPHLSYDELKSFHRTYYHPSNAKFFSYGNFPLTNHLDYIHDNYLKHFKRADLGYICLDQPRWQKGVTKFISCKIDPACSDPDKQTTASVSYLLSKADNDYENLVLSILSALLTDGPNSPFYKTLIESDLGSSYSSNTGFDSSTKDTSFSVGLQGLSSDSVNKLFKIIDDTFNRVALEGFSPTRIQAILHSIELNLKHERSNFGLGLLFNVLSSWNHGGNPIENLEITRNLDNFRECLKNDSKYLNKYIEKYFINNSHRLEMVMAADPEFQRSLDTEELHNLFQRASELGEADHAALQKQSRELLKKQNETEDLACLPTVTVEDIDPKIKIYPNSEITVGGVNITANPQPTNGITYFRSIINVRDLDDRLKPFLPLFCNMVTKVGTDSIDYRQFDHLVESRTGGLSASFIIADHPNRLNEFEEYIMLSSYSLDENVQFMLNLWAKLFNGVNFSDGNRLRTLLQMFSTAKSNNFVQSGHAYAQRTAASALSASAKLSELTAGVSQIKFLNSMVEKNDVEEIVCIMRDLSQKVLSKNSMRCSINATPVMIDKTESMFSEFVEGLPGCPGESSLFTKSTLVGNSPSKEQHLVYDLPVNFTSSCVPAALYGSDEFAKLRILGKLLSAKFLHREVREKGGAYGVSASVYSNGVFSFTSYRDPNSVDTFKAYTSSIDWTLKEEFSFLDVEEAKIAVFQSLDSPVAPGARGLEYFTSRVTDELRQRHRQQLLAVTRKDLVSVADKFFKSNNMVSNVLIGPENEELGDNWKVVDNCI